MRVERLMVRALVKVVVVGLALALVSPPAVAASQARHEGVTSHGVTNFKGDRYPYLLYTPSSYRAGHAAPLVVVAHGCQTTAAQEEQITQFDELADDHGFLVLYPEVDALSRSLPGPLRQCWKFPYPPVYFRGFSDTAAIAETTRAVMHQRNVDPQRVYIVGVSAGGLMASASAAAYPDLYAAVGIIESAGYLDGLCFTTGTGIPALLSAQLAYAAMGPRARVVPLFVMGSTGDLAFPQSCAKKALQQGLRTDNLVLSGGQTTPISLQPSTVRRHQKPRGYRYTVSSFRDPAGCLVGQQTIIDGMPHAWPGGSAKPQWAGYSDPKAPSGAKTAWHFFRRFTKRGTSMPCAETRRRPHS